MPIQAFSNMDGSKNNSKYFVTVHSAPFAKPRFQRSPLLRSSFLLMKWRSLRTFMQADFHASMKSAHKNVRVNCNNILIAVYVLFCLFNRDYLSLKWVYLRNCSCIFYSHGITGADILQTFRLFFKSKFI